MKNYLLALLFVPSFNYAQSSNLIKNGGFESELLNWNGTSGVITAYEFKAGKNSLVINQFVGSEWKGIDQTISIPKNTYAVQFSGWIKANDIEGGKDSWNKGIMALELQNGSGKGISNENVAEVGGTTGWKEYKKIILIPEGVKQVKIMLALAQTTGTILYDELKAIPVSEEDYLKRMQAEAKAKNDEQIAINNQPKLFKNGGFEEQLNGWSGSGKAVDSVKKEGTYCANVTSSTNDWVAIDQTFDIEKESKSIEISGWLKAVNIKQGKDSWNNGMFIAEFTNAENVKTNEDTVIGTVTGSTDWKEHRKELNIPAGTKRVRIMLALSACTGTLLADDIKVTFKQ